MLMIESRVFVASISGREITNFLLDCTDNRQWCQEPDWSCMRCPAVAITSATSS
jgi:hypothetical protein